MHIFNCELSLACTYALRNPRLARECASKAFFAALNAGRPDLAFRASEMLRVL